MGAAISGRLSIDNIRRDDYIILVVGSEGAGKSTFINTAVGKNVLSIAHPTLKLGAHDVQQIACSIPPGFRDFGDQRLVFVDVPAYDAPGRDSATVMKLRKWFREIFAKDLKIFGILYLQRVTDRRLSESPMQYLRILRTLLEECDEPFPNRVALVTTRWAAAQSIRVALEREEELGKYLDVLPRSCVLPRIFRFDGTFESAWSIVYDLLESERNADPVSPASARGSWSSPTSCESPELATPSERESEIGYNQSFSIASPASEKSNMFIGPPPSKHKPKHFSVSEPAIKPRHDDNARRLKQLSVADIAPSINISRSQQPSNSDQSPDNGRAPLAGDSLPAHTSSADLRDRCHALILKLRGDANWKEKIEKLTGKDAEQIVEFLNITLHRKGVLSTDDGKFLLFLLRTIAKNAHVIPRCYELSGIQMDPEAARGGGFADIYRGQYKNQKLCLKIVRLYRHKDNMELLRTNIKELTLWAHLSHQNILPFYGVFFHGEKVKRVCLVSPWIEQGSLRDFLQDFPDKPRLPLVFGVIDGLLYLHRLEIIHGDLKAQNVLIGDHGQVLIADFGLSRIATTTRIASSTGLANGTTRWKAPELFKDNNISPTRESDIWSFSCLCYEVFTRQIPFYRETDQMVVILLLQHQKIPVRPDPELECDKFDDRIWDIMKECWNYEPSNRPTCEDLRRAFTNLHIPGARSEAVAQDENGHILWEAMRAKSSFQVDYERVFEILLKIQQGQGVESQ